MPLALIVPVLILYSHAPLGLSNNLVVTPDTFSKDDIVEGSEDLWYTAMRSITFRSTTDRIYDGGPKIL